MERLAGFINYMSEIQKPINSAMWDTGRACKAGSPASGINTSPERLAESVRHIMEEHFEPMMRKNDSVMENLQRILPEELKEHCRLEQITNGQLKIKVDSSACLFSAQLASNKLLEQLQQDCPRAGIRKVRFVLL